MKPADRANHAANHAKLAAARALSIAALLLAGHAAPAAEKVAGEVLAKDSPRATAGGTTFTGPAGWTLSGDGGRRTLETPEHDLKIALLDVNAPSADEAVRAAWKTVEPGFKRALKMAQDVPARFGWEARRVYIYETSPNEHASVRASALKHGRGWTVVIVNGSEAGEERRLGQVRLVFDSLRPAGYKRESFAGKTAHPLDAERIKLITDFVEKARKAAGIPGVAIALAQDGKLVFSGGFGVRELGKPDPVDADSLFIIASNTKALTTLLLAEEVDAGRFTWDTPVTKVFPSFKLGDADVTKKVLMRHLVCACTGLPRQDLEWLLEFKNATPASELALLGTFVPTSKFGEVYQYSNIMATAAGYVGGYVFDPKLELGAAYDEAMQRRVLTPLGMKSTTFDFKRALAGNHASPHDEDIDGNMKVAPMALNYAIVPMRPAGGAWSSANDLVRYVQMELARGKLADGQALISEKALLERRAPQVAVGEDETYGMGLEVDRRLGVPVVHHGGSMIGYKSDMFWLPESNVGGVILINADIGTMMLRPFVRRVLEVLFDGRAEAEEDVLAAVKRHKESIHIERRRLEHPAVPAAVAQLAARYVNASLGELDVRHEGEQTIFDFGETRSSVASRKNDDGTTSFIPIDPGSIGLELVPGSKDGKRTLVARDGQHEYVFVEK